MKNRFYSMSFQLALLVLVSMVSGCLLGNDDKSGGSAKTYEGFGEWPEHEGHWNSYTQAAGDKHSSWVYMDVTIDHNGVFSGTYQSYQFDYIYNMSTQMGTIPISVYNPAGTPKTVTGAIDYDTSTGICKFQGMDETSFSIAFNSSNELVFYFDSDCLYTVSIVER